MVLPMVILTFAFFIFLDWYLHHLRRKKTSALRSEPLSLQFAATNELSNVPTDTYFHPGHTWVRLEPDGLVTAGTSELITRFVGQLETIELPKVGAQLRQGEFAWTLLSRRGRRLPQLMPVDGEVTEVNLEILEDPGLVGRSPFGSGWIFRVRPRNLRECLRNLITGSLAGLWMNSIKSRIPNRLSPSLGPVSPDGGELAPDLGDQLDDQAWEDLRRELFPADKPDVKE